MLRWWWDGGTGAPVVVTPPVADAEPVTPPLQLAPIPDLRGLPPNRVLGVVIERLRLWQAQLQRAVNERPTWVRRLKSEVVTLDTTGLTTDTVNTLLMADAVVQMVEVVPTVAVTTATTVSVGDASDATRFKAATAIPAVGTSLLCLAHIDAGAAVQASDAAVRLTFDANPGAGAMKVTVYQVVFRASTA